MWKNKNVHAEKYNNQGEVESIPGIVVSYDMGWTKRGKGHNSLTGHGASMGLKTGKVLSYATRCKACTVCESSKKSGKVAKTHDCRKNHVGSSKSMERDVAVEPWTNALDSGTQFSTYVGDDDSATIADILTKCHTRLTSGQTQTLSHHSPLQSEKSLQKSKLFNIE